MLLINDYFKGSGTTHNTQLHKTFTQKKTSRNKKHSKRKLSMQVLNKRRGKAKAYTKLSDNFPVERRGGT